MVTVKTTIKIINVNKKALGEMQHVQKQYEAQKAIERKYVLRWDLKNFSEVDGLI